MPQNEPQMDLGMGQLFHDFPLQVDGPFTTSPENTAFASTTEQTEESATAPLTQCSPEMVNSLVIGLGHTDLDRPQPQQSQPSDRGALSLMPRELSTFHDISINPYRWTPSGPPQAQRSFFQRQSSEHVRRIDLQEDRRLPQEAHLVAVGPTCPWPMNPDSTDVRFDNGSSRTIWTATGNRECTSVADNSNYGMPTFGQQDVYRSNQAQFDELEAVTPSHLNHCWPANTHTVDEPANTNPHIDFSPAGSPGHLSQYGQLAMSEEGPWSPVNPRGIPLSFPQIQAERSLRSQASDEAISTETNSFDCTSGSTGFEANTPGSSIEQCPNWMSDSQATLKPPLEERHVASYGLMNQAGRVDTQTSLQRPTQALETNQGSRSRRRMFEKTTRENQCYGPNVDARPTSRSSISGSSYLEIPYKKTGRGPPSPSTSTVSGTSSAASSALECDECHRCFNGQYGRGNPCVVPDCPKGFRRQDARLKHYRRHHPQLDVAPPLSRKRSL